MENKALLSKDLPDTPGVYFFKQGEDILYIGKATSLRDRVRSYFRGDILVSRGPKIKTMMTLVDRIDFQTTDSVLEALVLEAALIKRYQPFYNTRDKDDKSFWFVIVTQEDFPRILQVRGKELVETIEPEEVKYSFGPFPHGLELKEAMKIIRRIFPFRDKCLPCGVGTLECKSCFNRQIGLCPGVCSGEVSKADYAKTIRNLKLFFEGKKGELMKALEKDMRLAAKSQNFEQAAKLRNQMFALTHIQDVALIKRRQPENYRGVRIEAYDIAHLSGTDTVGVMVVVTGGLLDKASYRKFKLKGKSKDKADDTGNLAEVLRRRFTHDEWRTPEIVVIDGGKAQLGVAKAVLADMGCDKVAVVSVVKDDHHKAREIMGEEEVIKPNKNDILLANHEAHRFALAYHRNRRDRVIK